MKANELMIGDWYSWEAEGKKYYYQVTKETFSLLDDDIFNFQAVPLTPKILEKNGFKECDGEQWSFYKYKNDDYTKQSLYHVLWSKNEQYLEITAYTPHFGEYNRMNILFVHELQHALILCEIEKTIEL